MGRIRGTSLGNGGDVGREGEERVHEKAHVSGLGSCLDGVFTDGGYFWGRGSGEDSSCVRGVGFLEGFASVNPDGFGFRLVQGASGTERRRSTAGTWTPERRAEWGIQAGGEVLGVLWGVGDLGENYRLS